MMRLGYEAWGEAGAGRGVPRYDGKFRLRVSVLRVRVRRTC